MSPIPDRPHIRLAYLRECAAAAYTLAGDLHDTESRCEDQAWDLCRAIENEVKEREHDAGI